MVESKLGLWPLHSFGAVVSGVEGVVYAALVSMALVLGWAKCDLPFLTSWPNDTGFCGLRPHERADA